MTLRRLRTVRSAIAILSALVFGLLFLDVTTSLPPALATTATALQLLPALLKSLTHIGLWTAGAVAVLLLTLALGRAYCSTLCPLGTLQDLFIRLHRWKNTRRRYAYFPSRPILQYGILALTLALALGGSMTLLMVLEPFSAFGRMSAALARPVAVGVNNGLAWAIERLGTYGIARSPLHTVGAATLAGTLIFAGFIGYMSMTRGRWFCNVLCPTGALLSLVARFSFLRLVIDASTCKGCGLCEKVCKARCIDSEAKSVDFSACVLCFNCVDACPTVGLTYTTPFRRSRSARGGGVDRRRRTILAAALVPAAALLRSDTPGSAEPAAQPVSPPGSRSTARFTGLCTACHLCVSACPTQVLAPSFLEYGMEGLFQPRMDFRTAACTYECTVCGSVCPTGALLPLTVEEKKTLQLGKARFLREECIVITKKTDCGACSEHCPTKAVQMVPHEGKLFLPQVNEKVCVGCGACEHACPTIPRKAIVVDANAVHAVAEKPQFKKIAPAAPTDAFPF
jgi:ferredoxin